MTNDTMIYPDVTNDDLWKIVEEDLEATYPDRFGLDQKRKAFEMACGMYDDEVSLEHFLKRARIKCVWERPIIPPELLENN